MKEAAIVAAFVVAMAGTIYVSDVVKPKAPASASAPEKVVPMTFKIPEGATHVVLTKEGETKVVFSFAAADGATISTFVTLVQETIGGGGGG